ncbi:MAG TPA: hypothetical protein VFP84_33165 [Kofleriaceae bacterium]|nr:hypothetical protein [Kofleriaceae bacterium]
MRTAWILIAMTSVARAEPAPVQPPAYAENAHTRAGLIDVGATVGLLVAHDVRDVEVVPAVRWFVAESFAIAATASVTSTKAGDRSATLYGAYVEPSYHLELAPTTFAVIGMATGAAYERHLGTSLAIAPSLGLAFAVGRVSVISTALSYSYLTHSAADVRDNAALVALTSALRVHLGYAVRW